MEAPKILYVRVERRSLFPPQFQVSDKLEDFKNSGPVATYRLEKVGHLHVHRNLTNALPETAAAPGYPAMAAARKKKSKIPRLAGGK